MRNNYKKTCFFNKIKSKIKYLKWRHDIFWQRIKFKHIEYNQNPVWINPKSIKLIINDEILHKNKLIKKYGVIYHGNWDLHVSDINNNDFFISFYQKFVLNKSWIETPLYHRVLKQINSGKTKFGCTNKEEWESRLLRDEKLYLNIKENKYKTQKQLNTRTPWDEIRVAINRNGDIIFLDGRHRLSISKILGLEEIPVNICVIHPKSFSNSPSEILKDISSR